MAFCDDGAVKHPHHHKREGPSSVSWCDRLRTLPLFFPSMPASFLCHPRKKSDYPPSHQTPIHCQRALDLILLQKIHQQLIDSQLCVYLTFLTWLRNLEGCHGCRVKYLLYLNPLLNLGMFVKPHNNLWYISSQVHHPFQNREQDLLLYIFG